MGIIKQGMAVAGALSISGAAIGAWAELDRSDVAKGSVVTIDTCLRAYPHENVISKALENCLLDGVPGGNYIGADIETGQPIDFVYSLQTSEQQNSHYDVDRVIVWGAVAPFVVVGGIAVAAWMFG